MTSHSLKKEVCKYCTKFINIGQPTTECMKCDEIIHTKCWKKSEFTEIDFVYYCSKCSKSVEHRYNPFKTLAHPHPSLIHDIDDPKFYDDDPSAVPDSIKQSSKILEQCKSLSTTQINEVFNETNTTTFSSYFLNIDGNNSNFDHFAAEISRFDAKFSAIGLAETNTSPSLSHLYQISHYTSYYQDPLPDKHKGTGVALYIHNSLNATVDCTLSQTTPNLETLFVTIINTQKPITIGVIYRPPNGNFDSFIHEINQIIEILPNKQASYIMGDFNVDLFSSNSQLNKLEEIILTSTLTPLISIYTHDRDNCKKSCIDNILTNNQDNVIHTGTITDKLAHHLPIFQISTHEITKSPKIKLPQYYDYSNSNIDNFANKLSDELTSNDPSDFSVFLNTFQSVLDSTCKLKTPKMSKRNHNNNPWITTSIVESVKKKQQLYKEWKKTCKRTIPEGDRNLHMKYSAYRKKLKSIIKFSKSKFYCNKILDNKGSSKKTWEVINQLRGKNRRAMKPQFVINNKRITERRQIATAFNQYFASIASKLNSTYDNEGLPVIDIPTFSDFMPKSNPNTIFLSDSSSAEVENVISELQNGKASDIPITVIKKTAKMISPVLSKYFNILMQEGTFPSQLKTGKITPIYKKDNEELLENYRPVSTLPIFGKIFEKIIYKRLYSFLISQGVLHDKQFGFRKGHSTSHALNYSVELIQKSLKQQQHVLAIFIDLSKAFDTLDHTTLLNKLLTYGIRGNAHKLISSYLTGRTQYTSVLGENSKTLPLIFGVPQGSCLGPLLFLIYINDICNSSKLAEFVLFADDTNIFVTAKSKRAAYEIANNVLTFVNHYMRANKLHINMTKCCYMHFSPNNKPCTADNDYVLNLNNTPIKLVTETRFLGVTIDSKLSWIPHIKQLTKKLKCHIGCINRIKDNVPNNIHKQLYHTLFESHLTYGITVWGDSSFSKLEPIFILQKKCLRIMFGDKEAYLDKFRTGARCRPLGSQILGAEFFSREHAKPLFNDNNILTLHNLHNYHTAIETFKILKYRTPISLYSMFTMSHRKDTLLITPSSSHGFIHTSSALWNLVRQKFKIYEFSVMKVGSLKTSLKKFVLSCQKTGDIMVWNDNEINVKNALKSNCLPDYVY